MLETSCHRGDSYPYLSQQPGSTRLSGRFNPSVETNAFNPSAKQADHNIIYKYIQTCDTDNDIY